MFALAIRPQAGLQLEGSLQTTIPPTIHAQSKGGSTDGGGKLPCRSTVPLCAGFLGKKIAILRLGTGISFMTHHNGFCDHDPTPSTKHVPVGGTPCGQSVSGSSGLTVGAARWAELVSQAMA